jgi:protein ImuB
MALLPDGVPKRFTWRGRPYQVVRGDGPERIHGEWWRRASERDSVRDYFQVEDCSGARFWLYRRGDAIDGRTGDRSWHLHGLFA